MEALDFLKKLNDNGYEAYIVGGYVRDKLLGTDSTDIDIATNAKPKAISEIFDVSNKDNLGVINIKTDSLNVDITTFRKESHYIGHKPKNLAYVNDLMTDLKRRDFTINAICMDKDGNIIDLLNGQKDLEDKILRCVGKVKKKFSEDPLRMLRALRIAIIYNLKINNEELIFILNNKKLFNRISYDRKKSEIGKILISSNAIEGLNFLKILGLLDVLEINFSNNIVNVDDYVGMWSQLEYSENYRFTKLESNRIDAIREIVKEGKINAHTIYDYGFYDTYVASQILKMDKTYVSKLNSDMTLHTENELCINGEDIKQALKIDESPKIKEIKEKIITEILNGNLVNEKNQILEYIKKKWK